MLNSNIISLTAASLIGVEQGQCLTSSDAMVFPTSFKCTDANGQHSSSVMVRGVSYYSKKILVDQPTQDASSGTLSFTNYGPYNPGAGCNLDYNGMAAGCSVVSLYASAKFDAGNSIGGAGMGHIASCIGGGGPGDSSTLGFIGGDDFCFDHRRQFVAQSFGPFNCGGCGFDSKAPLFDIQQIGLLIGRGADPLALVAQTHVGEGSNILTMLQLPENGAAYNAYWAGWNVGDTLISAHFQKTITAISSDGASVTMDSGVSDLYDEPVYDVKPNVAAGNLTSGGTIIIAVLSDPTQYFEVGDILVAPKNGYIPPGSRIVALDSHSITLNAAATGSAFDTAIADTTLANAGTRGGNFAGAVLGGGGGIVFDSNASGCNTVQGSKIDENNPGQPAVEVVQGCALLTNANESQPNDFMVDAGGVGGNVLMTGISATGGFLRRIGRQQPV